MVKQTGEVRPVVASGLEKKVQNLRAEMHSTLDEGLPQHKLTETAQTAATDSIGAQTRTLMDMSESTVHHPDTVETSSGDETDTESEAEGFEKNFRRARWPAFILFAASGC